MDNICAAAMLYQKQDSELLRSVVLSCLIPFEEGDDTFLLKAKAERYISENEGLSEQVDGMSLSGWHFSINAPDNELRAKVESNE